LDKRAQESSSAEGFGEPFLQVLQRPTSFEKDRIFLFYSGLIIP